MKNNVFFFTVIACLISLNASAESKGDHERAGDVLQFAIPAAALITTYVEDDTQGRKQFYASFVTTVGSVYVLKYTVNRQRPNGADYSFPSGHTASAFAGASFIERRYGWKLGAPAYLLASYTGWTRVNAKKHYWSDVLAGAGIAMLSSYYFAEPFEAMGGSGFRVNLAPNHMSLSWGASF